MLFSTFPKKTRDFLLAKAKDKIIAMPEGSDERIVKAAEILKKELNVQCELGEGDIIAAGNQLAQDKIDAVIAGCTMPTAEVIRAAITTVGRRKHIHRITSAFLFALQSPTPGGEKLVIYSDCAVLPAPTSEDLVEIAYLAGEAFFLWTDQAPKISFLSFSTDRSAEHPEVQKVQNAAKIFAEKYPQILSEGEVQFDTACVPSVALRKKPGGKIQGKTNVFIFPDLNSGNICYKMTQYLGNSQAFGPVLLGCAKPFSDLSRGASVEDIVHVAILTLALGA